MSGAPNRYPIPAGEASVEFSEKNSIFIGTAGPAASVEEAAAFIAQVASRYADATHNAWAYLVGFGPSGLSACHNDGEPGGTAGPPALAALQGSGLGDVAVVITRYFGGVKLGTGGLARAYGKAAREAVAALPRAQHVALDQVSLQLDYHYHDAFKRLLMLHEAEIIEAVYGASVRFSLRLPADQVERFADAVTGLTAGRALMRRGSLSPDTS